MKLRITLGAALLVLGGLEAADPVHRFRFMPSAHANEQLTKHDEKGHESDQENQAAPSPNTRQHP